MDFGKYKYAQSKQMHAARMKQKKCSGQRNQI